MDFAEKTPYAEITPENKEVIENPPMSLGKLLENEKVKAEKEINAILSDLFEKHKLIVSSVKVNTTKLANWDLSDSVANVVYSTKITLDV